MSQPHADAPRLSATQDADLVGYHALSAMAVAGLVLGLLSALALLAPMLCILPGLGVVVSGWALWRIHRNAAALAGRRLAQCGLLLSILFGVAPAVDGLVYRRLLRKEARQFAAMCFEYLMQEQPQAPQKAYQLTLPPPFRQPLDEHLWDFYRHSTRWREGLEKYVKMPLVRTLLALGPKAEVRYYGSPRQGPGDEGESVALLYAVTYAAPEGKTTFFIELELVRIKLDNGRASWQLFRAEVVGPEGR